jgi:hypothetical protein
MSGLRQRIDHLSLIRVSQIPCGSSLLNREGCTSGPLTRFRIVLEYRLSFL